MILQTLTGFWQFRAVGSEEWLPATVPGGVYTDLLAAGRIPDPFVGENEAAVGWVAERDWEYRCEFTVAAAPGGVLAQERVTLVCAGLDTLAELTLNGYALGATDNMFREYRWEVKPLLREGANTMTIIFRSPAADAARRQAARPLPGVLNRGAAHLRKAQSHFGWDWGPALPTSGVWREIALEGASGARLADVCLRQHHHAGQVEIEAAVTLERLSDAPCELNITIFAPAGGVAGQFIAFPAVEQVSARIPIPAPQLWWPAGYGEQPLYRVEVQVKVEVKAGDASATSVLASASYTIGLRTIELRREQDAWGESFTFVVNGAPIFARGANWIPADAFPARVTDARLAQLIGGAAAAHMNMLRVWGGGYYESDAFYDLCDRHGILVWQDFMFACAVYPLDDPAFIEDVRAEVVQTVRRLRHHACLALWCGNNEIEMMWDTFWLLNPRIGRLRAAHLNFFHRVLPGWVQAEDAEHAYWPGSPSSGSSQARADDEGATGAWLAAGLASSGRAVREHEQPAEALRPALRHAIMGADTNSDACGDTHIWHVWHGLRPFTYFRRRFTRFCSEFGLESLPGPATIAAFASPQAQSMKSRVFRARQRSAGGNEKMLYYLTDQFRLPRDFADLAYLTQIVQAEAVRIGVEHWRRHRGRCMGALYWQLNDCWPAISWSSLDYFGRWKALHYAARRFNAPVALAVIADDGQVEVSLLNETRAAWRGQVRWSLETLAGDVIEAGEESVAAEALAVRTLRAFDFRSRLRERGRAKLVFVAELWKGDARIACQTAPFVPGRALTLPDPQLWAEVAADLRRGGVVIVVRSRALARFVELSLPGAEVVFSDNYFDLPARRAAHIACPLPAGWTVERVAAALRLRSLADVQGAGPAWRDRAVHHLAGLQPRNLMMRLFFALFR